MSGRAGAAPPTILAQTVKPSPSSWVPNSRQSGSSQTTMTIPAYKRTVGFPRSRQTITVQVPEQTITIPGIEQQRSQFGFILERTAEDNYTASVKLLTDNDVSQITQSVDQSEAMFMNASTVATRNAWHKAIAKVSGDEVTVEVYNDN